MTIILKFGLVAMTALLGTTACSPPAVTPATLMVLEDMSLSTPMSSDQAFADRAAAKVVQMIGGFRLGDTIIVQTLGDHTSKGRQRREFKLTPQMRHRAVAVQVGTLIASSPESELAAQEETAITFAVEQSGLRCNGRDHLVIIGDGIESRRGFDQMDAVILGKAELPKPPVGSLKSCKVTMLGIGVQADGQPQLNNEELRNLKAAWRAYFRAAGVADDDIKLEPIF